MAAPSRDRVMKANGLRCVSEPLHASVHAAPAYATIALRGRTVVRCTMDKKCRACGKGLPEGSTVRKVFCDSECRMNWHAEKRANGTSGNRNAKRSQSAKKVRSTQRSTGAETPTGTRPEPPRIATTQPRIPMEQQLLSQAPVRAIGYRLVLSPRPHDELPRLSPPIGVDGTLSFWRLRPFQAPNDWRLVDGALYRVLWVSESGEVVPPVDEGKLPGLLFHLHLCEADRVHSDGVSENEANRTALAETASNVLIQPTPIVEEPTKEVATSEPKGSPVVLEIVETPIEVLRLAADLEPLAEELSAVCLEHQQWREAERATAAPHSAMSAQRVDRYFTLARKLSDGIKPRPIQFLLLAVPACLGAGFAICFVRCVKGGAGRKLWLCMIHSERHLETRRQSRSHLVWEYCFNRASWRRRHAMRSSAFRTKMQTWERWSCARRFFERVGTEFRRSELPGGSIIVRCFLAIRLISISRQERFTASSSKMESTRKPSGLTRCSVRMDRSNRRKCEGSTLAHRSPWNPRHQRNHRLSVLAISRTSLLPKLERMQTVRVDPRKSTRSAVEEEHSRGSLETLVG